MKIIVESADLKIEPYRGSGPGGRHRNTTMSGVRITHLPTGIMVKCCDDSCQHRNKAQAFVQLRSALARHYRGLQERSATERYEGKPQVAFSSQIRTYRLVDEEKVVDHRTGVALAAHAVLRGKIDPFLRAMLAKNQGSY